MVIKIQSQEQQTRRVDAAAEEAGISAKKAGSVWGCLGVNHLRNALPSPNDDKKNDGNKYFEEFQKREC